MIIIWGIITLVVAILALALGYVTGEGDAKRYYEDIERPNLCKKCAKLGRICKKHRKAL